MCIRDSRYCILKRQHGSSCGFAYESESHCTSTVAKCDKQATVVGLLLTTLGDGVSAVSRPSTTVIAVILLCVRRDGRRADPSASANSCCVVGCRGCNYSFNADLLLFYGDIVCRACVDCWCFVTLHRLYRYHCNIYTLCVKKHPIFAITRANVIQLSQFLAQTLLRDRTSKSWFIFPPHIEAYLVFLHYLVKHKQYWKMHLFN